MSKQKGFAVISGSSTVVAKIMENGTVTFGGASRPVTMSISGSLSFGGLSGSSGVTIGGANTVLLVGADGTGSIGQLSASNIAVREDFGGAEATVSGALEYLSGTLHAVSSSSKTLIISGTFDGNSTSASLDLNSQFLVVTGTNSNISASVSTNGNDVYLHIGLNNTLTGLTTVSASNLSASVITASNGVRITGAGDLNVDNGNISGSDDLSIGGSATIGGPLTVNSGISVFNGDLQVTGNLYVSGSTVTIDTQNLRIKDPIILLGSSSATDPNATPDGDRGLIFGQSGSGQYTDGGVPALGWDSSAKVFKLGATLDDATSTTLTITEASGTLKLGTLSGSTVETTQLTASLASLDSATVTTSLTVNGDTTLGDGTDLTRVSGTLEVTGSTTLGTSTSDTLTVVGNFRIPVFTVNDANSVSGFPIVPDLYVSNASTYGGYSFYLTSSAVASNGIVAGSGSWAQANKWYFNENGEWFASFFYSV